jgi:predicted nucleic acid-binding protein
MSDKYFIDTNILMYAHDRGSGAKHDKAKLLLWRDRAGMVSTQVLQELAANLREKARKPLDAAATREVIADYKTWHLVVNGGDAVLDALDIEKRYQISFWDALIVQAAQYSGADVLYSEDLADQQQFGSVCVVKPFPDR